MAETNEVGENRVDAETLVICALHAPRRAGVGGPWWQAVGYHGSNGSCAVCSEITQMLRDGEVPY